MIIVSFFHVCIFFHVGNTYIAYLREVFVGTSLGLAITVDMLEIGPVDCHT